MHIHWKDGRPYIDDEQMERWDTPEGGISRAFYKLDDVIVKVGTQARNEGERWDAMDKRKRSYFAPVLDHGRIPGSDQHYIAKRFIASRDDVQHPPNMMWDMVNALCESEDIPSWDMTYNRNWWLVDGKPVIIDWGV